MAFVLQKEKSVLKKKITKLCWYYNLKIWRKCKGVETLHKFPPKSFWTSYGVVCGGCCVCVGKCVCVDGCVRVCACVAHDYRHKRALQVWLVRRGMKQQKKKKFLWYGAWQLGLHCRQCYGYWRDRKHAMEKWKTYTKFVGRTNLGIPVLMDK